MLRRIIILLGFLSINVCPVSPDSFAAVIRLKQGFDDEGFLLKSAEKALLKVEDSLSDNEVLNEFKRFVAETKAKWTSESKDSSFMEHPVKIFHQVRRFINGWMILIERLGDIDDKAIKDFIDEAEARQRRSKGWPEKELDGIGVAMALVRLRDVFLISFDELAEGNLNGTVHGPLTADEFRDIALAAYKEDTDGFLLYEAIDWLSYSVKMIRKGVPSSFSLVRSLKLLATFYKQYGNIEKALELVTEAKNLDTGDARLQLDYRYFKNLYDETPVNRRRTELKRRIYDTHAPWRSKYEALCRNDIKKSKKESAWLRCYLKKTQIPYRPADVEAINRTPRVEIYHRVVHEPEIAYIKQLANSFLHRSGTMSADGKTTIFDKGRVSQTGWVDDTDTLIHSLSKRIEMLTGLKTEMKEKASYSELMQVLNYGIGGMYEPHYDYFDEIKFKTKWINPPYLEDSGSRIATWMFYLNDVKIGGSTVFPYADAHVPVVRGGAVLWANLHRNGSYDERTLHAGCPVLMGSKWVANKWIRETGQLFSRPCKLDRLK